MKKRVIIIAILLVIVFLLYWVSSSKTFTHAIIRRFDSEQLVKIKRWYMFTERMVCIESVDGAKYYANTNNVIFLSDKEY